MQTHSRPLISAVTPAVQALPGRRHGVRRWALIAIGLCWALLAPAAGQAARETEPDAGRIVSARGETSLSRIGEVVAPADRKPGVRTGDRLRTGGNGRIEMLFADGMRMSLGPDTHLTITEYVLQGGQPLSWFDLARGTLRTITGMIGKRDPQSFRLRTPTAVVGVRGTDFTVVQANCPAGRCPDDKHPAMAISVTQGAVDVVTTGGHLSVNEGQSAVIGRPGEAPRLADAAAPGQSTGQSGKTGAAKPPATPTTRQRGESSGAGRTQSPAPQPTPAPVAPPPKPVSPGNLGAF